MSLSPQPVPSLRSVAVLLGHLTLVGLVLLLLWDVVPARFPAHAHQALSALPLALIAVACFLHRLAARPRLSELARTGLLAAAFLFWSANQWWPDLAQATLFNDLAVALFVLDVWLTIRERAAPVTSASLAAEAVDLSRCQSGR
ncbi:MAG TPA: hypothetical protein VN853_05155 [Polyangia bacterium]|nr:hypothetical protein [Polyangia bacterium]